MINKSAFTYSKLRILLLHLSDDLTSEILEEEYEIFNNGLHKKSAH